MGIIGLPLTDEQRKIVERLADAFLPLESWVATKKYVPEPKAPWRDKAALTAANMRFADFFEGLLRETSGDSDLKDRWDAFSDAPLARCPLRDASDWRANRGLEPVPKFAVSISDAVIVDTETRQISRAEFYLDYWPLLADAFAAADRAAAPGAHVDDLDFAKRLLSDENGYWPKAGQWRSSRFCRQFVKDLLYCYLGLRGVAAAPWSTAVLTELGEHRRVGNVYTSKDAAAAVVAFNDMLRDVREQGAKHPLAEATRKFFVQPVGSPPVNARDL